LTSASATGSVGDVVYTRTAALSGVQAQGFVGTFGNWYWSLINDTAPVNWQNIDNTQSPDWQQVQNAQAPGWQAIPNTQAPGWQPIDNEQVPDWELVELNL
jgi:hypothetical protein